ncbi:MAG: hypothetical protein AAB524_02845 [Patescibacteria group bacterium]
MKYITLFVGLLLLPSVLLAHQGEEHILVFPSTMDYEAETEVPVEVRIHAPESITSFRIRLRYNPSFIEVREVKPNTETFPYWWKKEAANGIIELEASLPKPGFTGESLVAGVVLTAKEAGSKLLEVDENASLLLNAQDENILELRKESSMGEDFPIANTQSTGLVAVFGILLVIGVVLGIVLFLRGRKK